MPAAGSSLALATAATPGRASSRASNSSKSLARASAVGNSAIGSCTTPVSTRAGSYPIGAPAIASRLRTRSPAPASRLTASASCPATSAPRASRTPRRSDPPRPSSRSVVCTSPRAARSAGTSPKTAPAVSATTPVTSTTVQSIERSAYGGSAGSARPRSAASESAARRSPMPPPATARIALSVSSCRITRPRPAPSATRTANSFRRESARESSAPPRFAQVMMRTRPALARRMTSGVRVSPAIASRSGTAS